jgi:hypothetical protein
MKLREEQLQQVLLLLMLLLLLSTTIIIIITITLHFKNCSSNFLSKILKIKMYKT